MLQDPKSKEIINAVNKDGNTPYHYACGRHHENIVSLILESGADCTITNNKGENAIKLIKDVDIKKKVVMQQIQVQQRHSDVPSSFSHQTFAEPSSNNIVKI